MKSKAWVDITELANWQGKPTGVPRVIDELSSRLAKDGMCVFVAWDGLLKGYHAVDFTAVQERASNKILPTAVGPSKEKLARIKATKNKLKQKSQLASKVLILPEKVARKLMVAAQRVPETDPITGVEPQKDDVLFVLADWHGSDEAFVSYLIDLQKAGVKLAQMSYDLLPIVTPQYSGHATVSLTNYTKQIYPICKVIFAISEHTKRDIIKWLEQNKLHVPRIEVIRLGDDFKPAKPIQPADEYFAAKEDFMLCVGTVEARKNHALLYYVYKLARQRGIDLPDLVIVGRRGWKSDDMYEVMNSDPETKSKFIMLENVSDEELSWLYKNCLFSVYPSFYEGWGLPIAESLAYGTPCICSNTSSMPEVAGELVKYFSPFSTDECLQVITSMLKPGAIGEAKRRVSAYQPTSWEQTFTYVNKVLGEINA